MVTVRTIVQNYTCESPAVIQYSAVVSAYTRKAQGEVKIPLHTLTGINPRQAPPLLTEQEDGWARHPSALSSGLRWVVVRMQLIARKYIEGPRLGQSWFSQYIASASPLLSCHSCNYGILTDQCASSTSMICIHQRRMCYNYLSHGDVVTIVESH